VELRLLAKMFTPEEAAVASVMRLTHEPPAEIGTRAGLDPKTTYRTLKGMARKGLIRVKRKPGQLLFGLTPFAVGFYEEQLPRMDQELAELVEQYLQETRGSGITGPGPALGRVIPVEEAIPAELEIYPFERATQLIEEAKAWAVRECICRTQQHLIGKGCDHTTENCMVLAPIEGAFDHSHVDRAITKEEALQILHQTEEEGLVHTIGNYRDRASIFGGSYICNCCTCCCAILRGVAEFGVPTAIAHSGFQVVVDAELCIGCGDCVERCQFGALEVSEDVCEVELARCVGCGVCTVVCPADALHLERRPEGEALPLAEDLQDWMSQRAEQRGISLSDIL
jgi:NAD-dependent dihydropyrimidine dehydrogenase PreA subunit